MPIAADDAWCSRKLACLRLLIYKARRVSVTLAKMKLPEGGIARCGFIDHLKNVDPERLNKSEPVHCNGALSADDYS